MPLKIIFNRAFALYQNISNDYLGLIAAGVAFYFLLAAFPALAAAISVYGLFSDPHFVGDQVAFFGQFLPAEATQILSNQTNSLLQSSQKALSLSLLVSIVLAVYSATKGIDALIKGLNIAYKEKEKRGFISLTLTGFILTGGLMVYLLLALSLIAGLPAVFNIIKLPEITSAIYLLIRWPLLFMTAFLGFQILYTYGPSHEGMKKRWFSWGSFAGTVLWVGLSSLFSLFVTYFGNYNETYGSISAIVVLLLWFWLSAMTVLIGAEINQILRPDPELVEENQPVDIAQV